MEDSTKNRRLTRTEQLEKMSNLMDSSLRRINDAFKVKEEALEQKEKNLKIKEELLKKEEELNLLNDPNYREFIIQSNKIHVLKGLMTAMTGESFLGLYGAPEGIDTERVYDEDEILHIKDKIKKIAEKF